VSGDGAYQSEMQEALFMDALRAAVPVQPDPRLGASLVPRLAETARAATIEAETRAARRATTAPAPLRRRPQSRFPLVARVGIAVALLPLVLAALAVAGVTVPSAARSAFDTVGISLPNQPAEHAAQPAATSPTKKAAGQGGNEVSQAAKTKAKGKGGNSAAAHEHARKQREKARGKAKGHGRGKAVGLNETTPPGRSGGTGPPANSSAGGNGRGAAKGLAKTPPAHTKTPPAGTKVPPGRSK